MAPRSVVTVPVSPSYRVDVPDWHPAGDSQIQRQKTPFLQATTGESHPSTRKYRALNDRIARAVAAYGRAEVLVYLRSIAHLSHL